MLSVDRHALDRSGALSERYREDVVAVAAERGGNPERLLAVLGERKDPRLKGFRTDSLEKLKAFLRENAYLDGLPVLNEEELRLRALASPSANELPDGVARDPLRQWWTMATRAAEARSQ